MTRAIAELAEIAMQYHVPLGCWPVSAPDNIAGVRVVVGRLVKVR